MEQEEIIRQLCLVGQRMKAKQKDDALKRATGRACMENPWFTEEFVMKAMENISLWLDRDTLRTFAGRYPFAQKAGRVAIIMAGNIPLVGFHDLMCVLLSGHMAIVKPSSKDKSLMPVLFDGPLGERITFCEERLPEFDAIIATGSNSSAQHFHHYFRSYPRIIRRSMASVGVISGKETREELQGLCQDIMLYMGLGCRSISKIFVPEGYDFGPLGMEMKAYMYLMDNNKYRNNYDYHKALMLMNNVAFTDLGCLLLIESKELHSGVSVLHYEHYDDKEKVNEYLKDNSENIPCIVYSDTGGHNRFPFGQAQRPAIDDFADNTDTMAWLGLIGKSTNSVGQM